MNGSNTHSANCSSKAALQPRATLILILATNLCAMQPGHSAALAAAVPPGTELAAADSGRIRDGSDGNDWSAFGRTYGEQHYSPLTEINDRNVAHLGLAWSFDIPYGTTVAGSLAVDGVVYVTTGYSVIRAFEATTGRLLWLFDPHAAEAADIKLRQGWGNRGIAYADGLLYTGTQDGRLIALDVLTGKPVWQVMTLDAQDGSFISGPPRVFDGKVAIGFGGADSGPVRGYVTAYDAKTGRQLWRFYTVPGDPGKGFENAAMKRAARTWAGQWWKHGGGGTVWNAMSYDPDTDTLFIGTGNGAPWNYRIRSAGRGDNLFLCSIVALNATTGEYKWHYQVNPAESWDYTATMDMPLATLTIDGKPRQVIMQAPKNGFFYVLDRVTGKLISAEPYARVNWAKKIDRSTGRPVEMPGIRYEKRPVTMWPGSEGAHNWLPMSFNPNTGLVYIPVYDLPYRYDDLGINLLHWAHLPGNGNGNGVNANVAMDLPGAAEGRLIAWNPVTNKIAWQVPMPSFWNGGTMTTAGNLVFQGRADGRFVAYRADTGERAWIFDAGSAVLAPPITYRAGGRQYVTVLSGFGASGGVFGASVAKLGWDSRTQARRVMTFVLDGNAMLPVAPQPHAAQPIADSSYVTAPEAQQRGALTYGRRCIQCHGMDVIAAGLAPDLRSSPIPQSASAFDAIVQQGALVARGMPRFADLSAEERAELRQYLRSRSRDLAAGH